MHRFLVLLASVACSQSIEHADRERAVRCRAIGSGSLSTTGAEVHVESQLSGAGQLTAGRIPACTDVAAATAVFVAVTELLPTIPVALRPDQVVIHYAPTLPVRARALEDLEAHRPSRSLLAAKPDIAKAIWLHELAHVRMHGERPRSLIGRRVIDAIEEGVADYYAAALTRSPRLPGRDLEASPRGSPQDWAELAFDSFDPHRLGWQWAAILWRIDPAAGALLEDLVACLAAVQPGSADDRVGAVLDAWLRGCPARSRGVITDRICRWVPNELAIACP